MTPGAGRRVLSLMRPFLPRPLREPFFLGSGQEEFQTPDGVVRLCWSFFLMPDDSLEAEQAS